MITQGSSLWYMLFPVVVMAIAFAHYKKAGTGQLLLIVLLFFSMFRGDNVGNDTKAYLDIDYIFFSSSSVEGGINAENLLDSLGKESEFGAGLLNYLVYTFDLPPRTIIFTYSILSLFLLYYSLKRLKINTAIGLVCYVLLSFYFLSFNFARQMAAVSIFVYGVTYLFRDDRKRFYFFFFTLIAASFHASAIFWVWVYALKYVRIRRRTLLYVMIVISIFTIISSYNIMDYVYRLLNIDYVLRYMGQYDESTRSLLGRINDAIQLSFLTFVFIIRNNNRNCDLFDILFSFGVVLIALFSHSSQLVGRISYYITITLCLYLPIVIVEKNILKNRQYSSFFVLYIFVVIYGFRTIAEMMTSGYYLMF